ncbi:ATP-binding protein [uncultured Methanospirillum sp.]|uniref:ATP-binding protein n=1 Tax=uncultured Methanospirillum sp. TaxID=262503 RepID=UPI0029C73BA4|nr:ATP-binding protein [uncultured Methanospirillum sp.]
MTSGRLLDNRLTGTSVLHYIFRTPADSPMSIGDLVVVDDQQNQTRFFARITGIGHDEQSGTGDTIGDTSLVMTAYPIGCIGVDEVFRRPRVMPSRYSSVRTLAPDDISYLNRFMGEIEVGLVVSGQRPIPELPVRIPAKVLSQHMGVFATTGMGKSNYMKVFCASAISARLFGLLIIDPHGEYAAGMSSDFESRGLLHHQDADTGLSVYSIQNEIVRTELDMKQLLISHDDMDITDLTLLFDLLPTEREVMNLLTPFPGHDIIDFFMNEDVESLPSHVKTTAYIGDHQDIAQRVRSANPDALRVVQRQIQTLVDISSAFLHKTTSSVPEIIEDLLANKVVLIDIPRMSEVAELFLLSVISRAVLNTYKNVVQSGRAGEDEPHRVLLTIEEAQRVLSMESEKTGIFRQIAMEGRKFGVGLCAITQQPKNIDPRVLAQMNTFVIMGLADRQDRETIASSAKHDLRVLDLEIQTLDRGDAIISTIGIPFPVSCHVHRYEDYIV